MISNVLKSYKVCSLIPVEWNKNQQQMNLGIFWHHPFVVSIRFHRSKGSVPQDCPHCRHQSLGASPHVTNTSVQLDYEVRASHNPFFSFSKSLQPTELKKVIYLTGIPRWLSGKEFACQCRRCAIYPWVGKFPWRRKWNSIPVFLPENSHGQRSLMGYSPWGRKGSYMTEHSTALVTTEEQSNGKICSRRYWGGR